MKSISNHKRARHIITGMNQTTPLGSGSSEAAAWEFASFASKHQPHGDQGKTNEPANSAARVVKSRPRHVKGLRVQLSLVRETGMVWRSYYFARRYGSSCAKWMDNADGLPVHRATGKTNIIQQSCQRCCVSAITPRIYHHSSSRL